MGGIYTFMNNELLGHQIVGIWMTVVGVRTHAGKWAWSDEVVLLSLCTCCYVTFFQRKTQMGYNVTR